jgi:hypothetical protein
VCSISANSLLPFKSFLNHVTEPFDRVIGYRVSCAGGALYKCTGCCSYPQFVDAETLVICQEGLCTFERNEVSYLSIMMGDIAHLRQRVSQLKIWHFLIIGIERNVCRCTFNGYSVITQFEKLAARESSCVVVALRQLQHFKPFKRFS